MNTTGVLDDYLEQLLGDATANPAAGSAGPRPADADTAQEAAGHGPALPADAITREPTWDDLPDEVIYETGATDTVHPGDDAALQAAFDNAVPAAAVEREPTWDDLPDEVIYETGAADAVHPGDDAALQAAFDNAVPAAAAEREPTWDDLPDEVIHETATVGSAGPCPADAGTAQEAAGHGPALPAEAAREPTWDDLPDEVIYETHEGESTTLTNADSPALEAAFSAAATPAAAPPFAPAARATPVVEPIAPSARAATPPAQATTWQELQAQAHRAPQSPHMNRRANERSSRWLRLRCGSQAYALELLKVQEVVLPVPLLPLRGTANAMLGIMNLRGQVVPVMDLGLHLGGAAAEDDAQTRIVVLEENGEIMGLRVSAVEDVTNLADSQIEPPDTARICRISNDVFRGVARLQQRPMILLDATRLLN